MAASRKPLPGKALADTVADSLGRHVPRHARLALALSGGRDSVVLLHVLLAMRASHPFTLSAVHVHHGLSPHAGEWAEFCARLCAAQAVDLATRHVEIAGDDPAGTEAAARRERHRVFSRIDTDFLATAHQQDDQAETLLLQLLRGAGPRGLAAMPELRHRAGWRAAHWRPLLGVGRDAIDAYATAHGLAWVEDESNEDVRYRRNALRQLVLPQLARHFPGCPATLARAAALQAEAAGLLEDLARLDAQGALRDDRLDCAALGRLPAPRARNLLRHFIEQHGMPMPNARLLNEALSQLLGARDDARVRVHLGAAELWRFRGGAYLVAPPLAPSGPVTWRGERAIWVPAAATWVHFETVADAGLRHDALRAGRVVLGTRQGGERLRLQAAGPRRSLKKLMQEHAIPPWHRDRLPLLWCDGELAWAAGIGLSADLRAASGEAGVLPRAGGPPPTQDSPVPGVLS